MKKLGTIIGLTSLIRILDSLKDESLVIDIRVMTIGKAVRFQCRFPSDLDGLFLFFLRTSPATTILSYALFTSQHPHILRV